MGEDQYSAVGGNLLLIGISDQQLLPSNPHRVGLLLFVIQGAGGVVVRPDVLPLIGQGIALPTTGYMEFTFSKVGPLVASAWFATANPPNQIVGWVEIITTNIRQVTIPEVRSGVSGGNETGQV